MSRADPRGGEQRAEGAQRPLVAAFVVSLVLIGAASSMFVGSYTSQRMAGLASRVQLLEQAIQGADLARFYSLQALLIAGEEDARQTLEETLDVAADAAASVTEAVEGLRALQAEPDVGLEAGLRQFLEAHAVVISLLESGQTTGAASAVEDGLDPAHQRLLSDLVHRQRLAAGEINQASSMAGRIADVVKFLLAFAIPAGAMGAYRWASDRQRQQESLRLELEAERQVNRSKDEFIASVSHELRTPLTGIVGCAGLLEESTLPSEDAELVDMIVAQSAELSRLIDDLLTAARIDADALTFKIEPSRIVADIEEVGRFMRLLGARVTVEVEDRAVMIDPERFRQVLRNLVVNAHRYGGPNIKVRGVVGKGRYLCQVIDDGPGVPPELHSRLFSRFVHGESDPTVTGSVGLGLAIVEELCRRMDCEVSYRRARGETIFTVSIPLAPAEITPLVRPASLAVAG